MNIEDKYREFESELSKMESENEATLENLKKEQSITLQNLIQDKAEIKSGIRFHKKKSKDYRYRFELFLWRLLKKFY